MPTLEPVLQNGYDATEQPPKGRTSTGGDRRNREEIRELPPPLVTGDFAICQLVHRADGKLCGERLSIVHARGYTDHDPVLDHLCGDAHRVELITAIGYALRTARLR
jgi:hypothetical protein